MPADLDKLEMQFEGLREDSSFFVVFIKCNTVKAEEYILITMHVDPHVVFMYIATDCMYVIIISYEANLQRAIMQYKDSHPCKEYYII